MKSLISIICVTLLGLFLYSHIVEVEKRTDMSVYMKYTQVVERDVRQPINTDMFYITPEEVKRLESGDVAYVLVKPQKMLAGILLFPASHPIHMAPRIAAARRNRERCERERIENTKPVETYNIIFKKVNEDVFYKEEVTKETFDKMKIGDKYFFTVKHLKWV